MTTTTSRSLWSLLNSGTSIFVVVVHGSALSPCFCSTFSALLRSLIKSPTRPRISLVIAVFSLGPPLTASMYSHVLIPSPMSCEILVIRPIVSAIVLKDWKRNTLHKQIITSRQKSVAEAKTRGILLITACYLCNSCNALCRAASLHYSIPPCHNTPIGVLTVPRIRVTARCREVHRVVH